MARPRSNTITLSMSLGMMVMYFIYDHYIFLVIAVLLVIISIFSKKLRDLIGLGMTSLINLINKLIIYTLLIIIYFFILVPTATLQKFLFQNPVDLKFSDISSYFKDRNHIFTGRDFEQTW